MISECHRSCATLCRLNHRDVCRSQRTPGAIGRGRKAGDDGQRGHDKDGISPALYEFRGALPRAKNGSNQTIQGNDQGNPQRPLADGYCNQCASPCIEFFEDFRSLWDSLLTTLTLTVRWPLLRTWMGTSEGSGWPGTCHRFPSSPRRWPLRRPGACPGASPCIRRAGCLYHQTG